MLVVAFAFAVLGPMLVWLIGRIPPGGNHRFNYLDFLVLVGCMFVGPIVILVVLDMVGQRILADQPAKFGPKVPTVGKWNT